jgi:hypothetical protein
MRPSTFAAFSILCLRVHPKPERRVLFSAPPLAAAGGAFLLSGALVLAWLWRAEAANPEPSLGAAQARGLAQSPWPKFRGNA